MSGPPAGARRPAQGAKQVHGEAVFAVFQEAEKGAAPKTAPAKGGKGVAPRKRAKSAPRPAGFWEPFCWPRASAWASTRAGRLRRSLRHPRACQRHVRLFASRAGAHADAPARARGCLPAPWQNGHDSTRLPDSGNRPQNASRRASRLRMGQHKGVRLRMRLRAFQTLPRAHRPWCLAVALMAMRQPKRLMPCRHGCSFSMPDVPLPRSGVLWTGCRTGRVCACRSTMVRRAPQRLQESLSVMDAWAQGDGAGDAS